MLTVFLFLVCYGFSLNGAVEELQYGNGPEGPSHWPGYCNIGKRQSPIDINEQSVVMASYSDLVYTNYEKSGQVEIVNLGETLQIRGFEKWGSNQPTISGGGLNYTYKLTQLHFHWSDSDDNGSEHTFYGTHLPFEIHFLHIKEGKTLDEALLEPDGLMALAVFGIVNVDTHYLAALVPGLKMMENTHPGNNMSYTIIPDKLLPFDRQVFYRYEGSLTTPNCEESVIWTILAAPISINKDQLSILRAIRDAQHLDYSSNVRPTQSLNNRKIQFREKFDLFKNILRRSRIGTQIGSIFRPKFLYKN